MPLMALAASTTVLVLAGSFLYQSLTTIWTSCAVASVDPIDSEASQLAQPLVASLELLRLTGRFEHLPSDGATPSTRKVTLALRMSPRVLLPSFSSVTFATSLAVTELLVLGAV